jgi:hypothetical protein
MTFRLVLASILGWIAAARGARAEDLRNVFRGAVVESGFETGRFGEAIPANLGIEWRGIATVGDRRYLVRWSGTGGPTLGYFGNEHPGMSFFGGQLALDGEVGRRLRAARDWSGYFGVGATFHLSAVALPSVSSDQYTTINDPHGVAGVHGIAATRVSAGVSKLGARHSVLLTAFVQEALRAPETLDRADGFTEIGMRAQLDLVGSLESVVEWSYGTTREQTVAVFGGTTSGTYVEASASVSKFLGERWWLALQGLISRRSDQTTDGGGHVYDTAGPLSPVILLSGGLVL